VALLVQAEAVQRGEGGVGQHLVRVRVRIRNRVGVRVRVRVREASASTASYEA